MGFFSKLFGKSMDQLCAPVAGQAVPVSEVPDPTFSEGLLGNGIAILPTEGKIYAPPCWCATAQSTPPSKPPPVRKLPPPMWSLNWPSKEAL